MTFLIFDMRKNWKKKEKKCGRNKELQGITHRPEKHQNFADAPNYS